MLNRTILWTVGILFLHPDEVLTAILAALVLALCLYVSGWVALIFWILDG